MNLVKLKNLLETLNDRSDEMMNDLKVGDEVRNIHLNRFGVITGFTGFAGDQVKVKRIIDINDDQQNFNETWSSSSVELKK